MTKFLSFLIIIFGLWFSENSWGKEDGNPSSGLTPNPLRPLDPYALPGAVPADTGVGVGPLSPASPGPNFPLTGTEGSDEHKEARAAVRTGAAVVSIAAAKDCCCDCTPLLNFICASTRCATRNKLGGCGIGDCISSILCCPLKCAWSTLKCLVGCCCCSKVTETSILLAAASNRALTGSDAASPPPPPKPPRVLYTIVDKNAVTVEALSGFWFLGDSQHPSYPFTTGLLNTVLFQGKMPKLTAPQLDSIYTGVSQIILEFPLNTLDPLKELGSRGAEDNRVSSYTLHIRGPMKSSDFKKLRGLLVSWIRGEGARCDYLDFSIRGMQGAKIVKEIIMLLCWPVCHHIKGLSIRFSRLTDNDLGRFQQGVVGLASNLEELILSSNHLTDKSLKRTLPNIVKQNGSFPKLQNLNLEGNNFTKEPTIAALMKALKERSTPLVVHLGFNGIDATTLRTHHTDLDASIQFEESGFTSFHPKALEALFKRHNPLLEEDPSLDVLADWRQQLWTLLAFGSQPLNTLNFNGRPLDPQALAYLLNHVRASTSLQKLSLVGSIGEDPKGENHALLIAQIQRFSLRSLNLGGNFRGIEDPILAMYITALGSLSSLVYLGLSGNDLGTRQDLRTLWEMIQGLKNLTALDLSQNRLTAAHLRPLVTAITRSKLKYLNLSGNEVTLDAPTTIQFVQDVYNAGTQHLQLLNLIGNAIVGTVVGELTGTYSSKLPILQIDGTMNEIPSADVSNTLAKEGESEAEEGNGSEGYVIAPLPSRGPIVYLGNRNFYKSLSQNFYKGSVPLRLLQELLVFDGRGLRIDPQALRTLSRTFTGNLQDLDLGYTLLALEEVKDLAQLLMQNLGIQRLSLPHMNIGPTKAGLLATALHQMIQLRDFDLSGNRMTKVGFRSIVEALNTKPLETLNLSGNVLKKGSAKTLKTLLPTLTVLKELILANNQFGKGAKLLAEALQTTSELTHIDLSKNGIGLSQINALAPGLSSQTNLTKLTIGFNPLKDDGVRSLAIVLRSLPALGALSIPSSQLGRAGALMIRDAIAGREMEFLDLRDQRKEFPGPEVFGALGIKHLVL